VIFLEDRPPDLLHVEQIRSISAALVGEQGYASDWSALFAGMIIAMLPVLVVYLIFHRRIREGFVAGALK
jgi:ABC-type glycerol-3-phosphate transport system permease component